MPQHPIGHLDIPGRLLACLSIDERLVGTTARYRVTALQATSARTPCRYAWERIVGTLHSYELMVGSVLGSGPNESVGQSYRGNVARPGGVFVNHEHSSAGTVPGPSRPKALNSE